MNGFIYILSNTSLGDGRIKIGQSKSDPSSFRKDELYTTGVAEPFKVEYYAFVENYQDVERNVHRVLDRFRPNKDREFFNVSIGQAILAIRENSTIKYEEVFYKSKEEIIKEQIKRDEEKRLKQEKTENETREKEEQRERDRQKRIIENERIFEEKQQKKKEIEPVINIFKFLIGIPVAFFVCGVIIYILESIYSLFI